MPAVNATIRPARTADLPAIAAVFLANEDHADYPEDAIHAYLGHLVARGTVAVAERAEDGAVVAFGAAVDTGRATHLADLFVLPALHGSGLGGRLLDGVFGQAWPRTTFASDDPRALPLYVRAGMTPDWVNLYVSGDPARIPPVAGHSLATIAWSEMAEHEAAWTGVDRGPDLGYWSGNPGARAFAVRAKGRTVAVGSARLRMNRRGFWIDHAQVAPDADAAPALLAAMRAGAGETELVGACVPGPSPLLPALLEARFRVMDRDVFLASDPALVDPARELVNTGIL